MDQIKIGKFIAECRKAKGYTQASLAEQLHMTNRAVSKWENGHSLPDAAIMLDLCKLLGITVTELLEGEKGVEKNEELLIEMVKQKQAADKRLLRMEIITGVIGMLMLITAVAIASFVQLPEIWRVLIIVAGLIPLLVAMPFMIQIEQTAGYYECQHCKHRYVPTFKAVFMAMHTGRTRYMKCPECGKRSWQKKVLTKE
ncbi:MAG: helix-turn-helix transcriptional regulator [Bacteroidaceae bacterium]|nr:helix-turn-helix transcriptional regulator [Bacteroidaceae bacterium]